MTFNTINSYAKELLPELIGIGSMSYLIGHLASYIANGATPHAFGTAVTIGWTVTTIAQMVFVRLNDNRLFSLSAGIASGYWLTQRFIYPMTFTDLLKTSCAISFVSGVAILIWKYITKQRSLEN